MKQFNGFKPEKPAVREVLPAGGYVLKIMNAEEQEYTWGSVIVVSFDVAEGDRAGAVQRGSGRGEPGQGPLLQGECDHLVRTLLHLA